MQFIRSSFCKADTPQCVEVALIGDEIQVRDTKDAAVDGTHIGAVLAFTPAEWEAFIEGVKAGEFDRAALTEAFVSQDSIPVLSNA